MSKIYNLFISHSWNYGDKYQGVIDLIDKGDISYKNYSVPKNDPIHNANNDKELYAAIEKQIRPASVVIILAGVYATYSNWINKEIEIANKLGKAIIAVEYWGSEHTSSIVKNNADSVVKWQSSSIISAIKDLG